MKVSILLFMGLVLPCQGQDVFRWWQGQVENGKDICTIARDDQELLTVLRQTGWREPAKFPNVNWRKRIAAVYVGRPDQTPLNIIYSNGQANIVFNSPRAPGLRGYVAEMPRDTRISTVTCQAETPKGDSERIMVSSQSSADRSTGERASRDELEGLTLAVPSASPSADFKKEPQAK